MKKLMAGLLTLSLVAAQMPMMVFAASAEFEADAKIVGLWKMGADFNVTGLVGGISGSDTPELQMTVTDAAYTSSNTNPTHSVEISFGNAELMPGATANVIKNYITVYRDGSVCSDVTVSIDDVDDDGYEFTLTGMLEEDDIIAIQLVSQMDITSKGKTATVSVSADGFSEKDLLYCATMANGVEFAIDGKVNVAEGEIATLDGVTISPVFEDMYSSDARFTFDLNKGFEFPKSNTELTIKYADKSTATIKSSMGQIIIDGDEMIIYPGAVGEFTVYGIQIEATTATVGDVATMTVDIYDNLGGGNAYSSILTDASIPSVGDTVEPTVEVDIDAVLNKTIAITIGADVMMVSGEEMELPVPAYITDAGYTMMPVSAVASALGVASDAIVWDGTTKTVQITIDGKVVEMTIGADVMLVDGEEMEASSAPEITNDRTFLPVRDLANALGIANIDWDNDTKTATLILASSDDVETVEA
ncbi:copper amine oxidase N-terminal domain-containing protein [Chakrabartyella piscis]|uniref:copper amine oxidase N-terminal domain-containing protein n=1 Tax=Chakrabartyella piscis TaxID=2918914 RepID=UPI002958828F|nr:copper amine oxidase N-terminal domain-containing protein [Chakrabartyella piscis]